MLQQTRVATALPYYERFLATYPKVAALAAASEQDVLRLWQGLGYYTRARNLYRAARVIVYGQNNELPQTAREWRTLPGIGRYTANAIASIAYDEPVPVVDGNVKRILVRLAGVHEPIDERAVDGQLWEWADRLLARRSAGDFNQALMELGARVCTPRRPSCDECPVRRWCVALRRGIVNAVPVRKPRATSPVVTLVAVALERRGCLYLTQRQQAGLLYGMWTLPAVEAKPKSPQSVLREYLLRAHGMRIDVASLLGTVQHVFSHRRWTVKVFRGCLTSPRGTTSGAAVGRWVRTSRLDTLPCAAVDRKMFALSTRTP